MWIGDSESTFHNSPAIPLIFVLLAAESLSIPGPRFWESCDSRFAILVAPYCAIPRDYLSDTPLLRAMGFLVSQHGQLGAIPPPPFSVHFPLREHAKWRCDTPPQKGYLSDTCAIPYENKANGRDTPLCDTISKRYCAIWGGISHWAAKFAILYHLKVFPDLHFDDNASRIVILLHDNLLSCHVPWCGNATASTSIIAIGNRLRHPKGEFPPWVSKYEQDPLFWDSGVEGMALLQMICGSVGFLMLAMVWKLDGVRWLIVISRWQVGSADHLWLVRASSHLVSLLVKESLLAMVFLMLLLSWDLYICPQTLAMASACLRSSVLFRTLVFLCWCQLSFHSVAVEHLTREDKNEKKKLTAKVLRETLLLWLKWCVLTVVFSIAAILYQVSNSIPGFLPVGKIWSLGLKAFVGCIQAVVSNFIMPFLASRVTWRKHLLTRVSNLIMNCLIPAVIIIYLDAGCLKSKFSSFDFVKEFRHFLG